MTLQEFITNLHTFIKKNPDVLAMEVVTSVDDEGNGFNPVLFSPQEGIYKDHEFISVSEFKKSCHGYCIWKPNAVCIN